MKLCLVVRTHAEALLGKSQGDERGDEPMGRKTKPNYAKSDPKPPVKKPVPKVKSWAIWDGSTSLFA